MPSQLGDIVENVRRNLQQFQNISTIASQNFYQDSELKQFIGEAYRHYFNVMSDLGEGFFETTTDLAITANVPTVDISGINFFKISNLYKRITNRIVPLQRKEFRYNTISNIGVGGFDSYIPYYSLRGMNIVLEPTPRVTEAAGPNSGLRLDYIQIPNFPVFDSLDNFVFVEDFPDSFEPMVEIYATISALESKDAAGGISDIQSFRGRLKNWESQFTDAIRRDESPDRVVYSGLDYSNPFSLERL